MDRRGRNQEDGEITHGREMNDAQRKMMQECRRDSAARSLVYRLGLTPQSCASSLRAPPPLPVGEGRLTIRLVTLEVQIVQ
jgi:hypothetical protein